jgi:biopolymer transport protein ExbB/TolQ
MDIGQSSLWQLVRSSDTMTLVVLALLLGMSVFCWTVFLYKLVLLRIKKKQLKSALAHMKNAEDLEDVLYVTSKFSNTLPGYFLSKSLAYLKSLLMTSDGSEKSLCDREWNILEHMMHQVHDSILYSEEQMVPLVGASAAIAPLLGLFGTIWGLMNAFIGISHQQSADITAIAPGIAQALTTTVGGLLVAIPALVIFNYLNVQLRSMDEQLNMLSDRFMWLAQRLIYEKKKGK